MNNAAKSFNILAVILHNYFDIIVCQNYFLYLDLSIFRYFSKTCWFIRLLRSRVKTRGGQYKSKIEVNARRECIVAIRLNFPGNGRSCGKDWGRTEGSGEISLPEGGVHHRQRDGGDFRASGLRYRERYRLLVSAYIAHPPFGLIISSTTSGTWLLGKLLMRAI